MKLKLILLLALVCNTAFAETETTTKKHYGIAGAQLLPQPEVKKEGSYMINGTAYTTRTHDDTKNYAREGTASYYHNSLAGNPTSSGEAYHPAKFTAAHKTLPIGSYAVVTNLLNNRKVIVKINDRGPFIKTRLIDLSQIAAQEIGMLTSGIARVRVEALQVDRKGKISGAGTKTLLKSVKTKEGLYRLKEGANLKTAEKKIEAPRSYIIRIVNISGQKQADELLKGLSVKKDVKTHTKKNGDKVELFLTNIATKAEMYQLKNKLSKLDKEHQFAVYTYH